MIFVASDLFVHFGRFGHFGLWSGHFFGLFPSPFFIFLGLLFLFAVLRRRDRWSGNSGGGYGQGRPWAPPPPQDQAQQPGNYAGPYANYGNPGNPGNPGVPTHVDVSTNPDGGASTIRMDAPAQSSGEPTRALNMEAWSEQGRIQPPEDDAGERAQQ